ncbi:hypothetical protein AYO20_00877 [Fonsecaea nubica]|uniref:Uncharacterized protein n=1 Tax=Fonsecaea nubica TaxID=856822 RepID=A0A178DF58_9EURO|nr:hypothetical protein AYO20_00877 [Fonsecaea nubica]OAL39964.1 hypothetical protein AYO20_00877 [Fonsecaea nubica]
MSSSSSSSWQDRRFMFPAGREVHESTARRLSGSSGSDKTADSPILTNATPAAAAAAAAAGATPALPDYPVVERKVLSNPDAWGGDRRFMGMAGKEVHEPSRRLSGSSAAKPADVLPKASSPPATSSGGGIAAAIAGRRRSSASNQGGIFSGLMANRDVHADRRQSWEDMKKPEGFSGFLSGLVNTKPADKK